MATEIGIGDVVRLTDGLSARILSREDTRVLVRLLVANREEWRGTDEIARTLTQAPGARTPTQTPTPTPTPIGAPTQPATGGQPAEAVEVVQLTAPVQVFAGETTLAEISKAIEVSE